MQKSSCTESFPYDLHAQGLFMQCGLPISAIAVEVRFQPGVMICAWRRVSEMLEVMEKADRLYVEEPMRRSMGEATTSDDSSIRFNEVLHFTFYTLHTRKLVSFIRGNGPHIYFAGALVQVLGQGLHLGHLQHPLQRGIALGRPGSDVY